VEELLEGFSELNKEWQDKVYKALEDGHVDDEDWLGDPAYNRPGKSGMTPRKRKVVEEPVYDSDAASQSSSRVKTKEEDIPVKKRPTKKAKVEPEVKSESNSDVALPTKKSRAKKVKPLADESIKAETKNQVKLEADDDTVSLSLPPKKKSRSKKVKVEAEEQGDTELSATEIPAKKRRGRKVKEEEPVPVSKDPVTTRSGRRTNAPNYRE
jgi:hypothetical protein